MRFILTLFLLLISIHHVHGTGTGAAYFGFVKGKQAQQAQQLAKDKKALKHYLQQYLNKSETEPIKDLQRYLETGQFQQLAEQQAFIANEVGKQLIKKHLAPFLLDKNGKIKIKQSVLNKCVKAARECVTPTRRTSQSRGTSPPSASTVEGSTKQLLDFFTKSPSARVVGDPSVEVPISLIDDAAKQGQILMFKGEVLGVLRMQPAMDPALDIPAALNAFLAPRLKKIKGPARQKVLVPKINNDGRSLSTIPIDVRIYKALIDLGQPFAGPQGVKVGTGQLFAGPHANIPLFVRRLNPALFQPPVAPHGGSSKGGRLGKAFRPSSRNPRGTESKGVPLTSGVTTRILNAHPKTQFPLDLINQKAKEGRILVPDSKGKDIIALDMDPKMQPGDSLVSGVDLTHPIGRGITEPLVIIPTFNRPNPGHYYHSGNPFQMTISDYERLILIGQPLILNDGKLYLRKVNPTTLVLPSS